MHTNTTDVSAIEAVINPLKSIVESLPENEMNDVKGKKALLGSINILEVFMNNHARQTQALERIAEAVEGINQTGIAQSNRVT